MKRIRLYALLLASVIAVAVLVARDPLTQSTLRFGTPNVQDQYARALCEKDARYLTLNSGGDLELPRERWDSIIASLRWRCEAVRYLGVVQTSAGPEHFYAFDIGDYEIWFGFTVVDGKVIDAE